MLLNRRNYVNWAMHGDFSLIRNNRFVITSWTILIVRDININILFKYLNEDHT